MNSFSFSSGNATLAAESDGSGQPLICLHAGVADKRMWRNQLHAFNSTHQVIAYDRREFGDTTSPDEPFRHMDDLAELIAVQQLSSPVLLGCSQGGRIAIDFALANPGVAAALILISTALSGAPTPEAPDDIQELIDALDAAEERQDNETVNQIEAHMWLDGPRQNRGRVGGDMRTLFLDMNGCALDHAPLYAEQDPPDAIPHLQQLTLPILLIHGALDFPHVLARHRGLAERWPHAETIEIADCAHLPSLEQPDVVNQHIKAFLDQHELSH